MSLFWPVQVDETEQRRRCLCVQEDSEGNNRRFIDSAAEICGSNRNNIQFDAPARQRRARALPRMHRTPLFVPSIYNQEMLMNAET